MEKAPVVVECVCVYVCMLPCACFVVRGKARGICMCVCVCVTWLGCFALDLGAVSMQHQHPSALLGFVCANQHLELKSEEKANNNNISCAVRADQQSGRQHTGPCRDMLTVPPRGQEQHTHLDKAGS